MVRKMVSGALGDSIRSPIYARREMSPLAYDRLMTTIHFPEGIGGVREFEIGGHVYMAPGEEFRWDDGGNQRLDVESTPLPSGTVESWRPSALRLVPDQE
jgi:hypothetical protein